MALFVEFHLIQNFAPSNLNRDDTGAPKDALFGGHRRARVSSQCFKRQIRLWVKKNGGVSPSVLGTRTRHLEHLLAEELAELGLSEPSKLNEIVSMALKKKNPKGEKAEEGDKEDEALLSYLFFISPAEIMALGEMVRNHADTIKNLAQKRKLKPTDVPDQLKDAIKASLSKLRAVDIALFGRMLADLPSANQDAACQVAHAISTHRVEREFDYFTAVDDEGAAHETGAGMIGQVEFNSATFYRYAVVDAAKLVGNLQQDSALALTGLEAFTKAMARAIPSGKQNTFAAHNLPAFVGVVLRRTSPINLANAFEKPVWPKQDFPLSALSVAALAEHDNKVSAFYGDGQDAWAYLDLSGMWPDGKGKGQPNLDALATWVKEQVASQLGV